MIRRRKRTMKMEKEIKRDTEENKKKEKKI